MARNANKMNKAIALLKLLSHPVRLSILCNLVHEGEMSVTEIVAAEAGAASQSQISQFLGKMREEGLVKCRREAQTIYYQIKSTETKKLVHALYDIYCARP